MIQGWYKKYRENIKSTNSFMEREERGVEFRKKWLESRLTRWRIKPIKPDEIRKSGGMTWQMKQTKEYKK